MNGFRHFLILQLFLQMITSIIRLLWLIIIHQFLIIQARSIVCGNLLCRIIYYGLFCLYWFNLPHFTSRLNIARCNQIYLWSLRITCSWRFTSYPVIPLCINWLSKIPINLKLIFIGHQIPLYSFIRLRIQMIIRWYIKLVGIFLQAHKLVLIGLFLSSCVVLHR